MKFLSNTRLKETTGYPCGCTRFNANQCQFLLFFFIIFFSPFFFFQVKACTSKGEKIDITSFKDKFRLAAGQYTGTITLQCNSGTSCFKFDGEFKRGK